MHGSSIEFNMLEERASFKHFNGPNHFIPIFPPNFIWLGHDKRFGLIASFTPLINYRGYVWMTKRRTMFKSRNKTNKQKNNFEGREVYSVIAIVRISEFTPNAPLKCRWKWQMSVWDIPFVLMTIGQMWAYLELKQKHSISWIFNAKLTQKHLNGYI